MCGVPTLAGQTVKREVAELGGVALRVGVNRMGQRARLTNRNRKISRKPIRAPDLARRMAELQAKYYAAEFGMEIAIVRPFNAFGERCRWQDATSHVIPSLVTKVMRGDNPIVIWGSGEQRRNFLHVKDFAWGMKVLTERYAIADPVNLGLEETVSIRELLDVILRVCGRQDVRIESDSSKPEGRRIKSADSGKLCAIMPEFESRMTLEDGMREVVDWYRRQA